MGSFIASLSYPLYKWCMEGFPCTSERSSVCPYINGLFSCVTDEDVCKLYCIAEDYDFFFAMSSKVKDGTPCYDHKGDVCVDGVCEVNGLD